MRAVTEWIGKTDDAAIPARVCDRVSMKSRDCCAKCTRKIGDGLKGEIDHVTPLILGGQHRESNLQLLCVECHSAKTRLDVKLKARVARSRKKRLGFKRVARPLPGTRASGLRKRMNGSVERW